MSGVNLDALSDEQLDAMIAGCRLLRTMRAPYLENKAQLNPSLPAIEADSVEQALIIVWATCHQPIRNCGPCPPYKN